MGPNIHGVPTPYNGGGGRKRKRKKKGGFLKFIRDLIVAAFVAFAISALILAIPLFLGFDPIDADRFVQAPGFEKIDAFMDGWRHKHGISEMTFSHDGRSITFTDEGGTLTGIGAEGYDYGDGAEYESDLEEARRLLKEWGLDG